MHRLHSSLLSAVPKVFHGFFYPGLENSRPRFENNFSFKQGTADQVRAARAKACRSLRIAPEKLTHVYQVHGTGVWRVLASHCGAGAVDGTRQIGEGDAMVTAERGIPLGILIADCLPVFFADRHGRAVGIAHAGWRGSLDAVSVYTLQSLHQQWNILPEDIVVWIAPGISHHHFEVGQEVWDRFRQKWGHVPEIFHQRDGFYLDLKRLNRHQLVHAGVLPQNIETAPQCTYQERAMFSYRRDGAGSGHNLAVIGRYDD